MCWSRFSNGTVRTWRSMSSPNSSTLGLPAMAARAAAGSQRTANRAADDTYAVNGGGGGGTDVFAAGNDLHGKHSFAFGHGSSSGDDQASDNDTSGAPVRQPQQRSAVMTARARLAEARRKLDRSFEGGEGEGEGAGDGDGNDGEQGGDNSAQLAIAGHGVAATPPQAPAHSVRANVSALACFCTTAFRPAFRTCRCFAEPSCLALTQSYSPHFVFVSCLCRLELPQASSRTTESQRKAVARMTVQRRRRAEQAQERKQSVRNYNKRD